VDKCLAVGYSGIYSNLVGKSGKSYHGMFIGEYQHSLDEKNRVSLPKSFRTGLGKRIVMTRGLDNCLFVFSRPAWEKVAKRLEGLSLAHADTRGFNRFMLSGAVEVEVDGAGRILVPEHQKAFADLKKNVTFTGVSDRVEVWESSRWNAYKARIERNADTLAEKLGEIGAL